MVDDYKKGRLKFLGEIVIFKDFRLKYRPLVICVIIGCLIGIGWFNIGYTRYRYNQHSSVTHAYIRTYMYAIMQCGIANT